MSRELRLFLNRHYEKFSPEKHLENLKILFFEEGTGAITRS
ncbi:MAG: hypothetical protein OK474_06580 [Thaumarchaeota archaeon]|nr:hypothetical protein [Nitrososphaerota archaeon]